MYYDITHKHPKPKKKKGVQYGEHNAHFQYKELYNRLLQLIVEFDSDRVGREGVYFQEDESHNDNTILKKVKAFSMANIFNKQPMHYFAPYNNTNDKRYEQRKWPTNKSALKKTMSISNIIDNCNKNSINQSRRLIYNLDKNSMRSHKNIFKDKTRELTCKSDSERLNINKEGGIKDMKVLENTLSKKKRQLNTQIGKRLIKFNSSGKFLLPSI